MDVKERLKNVKLIVSDFDGVMTDNRVLVREDGLESVFCNRGDGFGIERLLKKGIKVVVLSKEKNRVVRARCEKLGIEAVHGIDEKKGVFLKIIEEKGVKKEEVCFVGNDVNDLECVKESSISVVPADAHPSLLEHASYVTKAKGGWGVIRELADLICG